MAYCYLGQAPDKISRITGTHCNVVVDRLSPSEHVYQPGVKVIKPFYLSLVKRLNRLERLSMANLSTLV